MDLPEGVVGLRKDSVTNVSQITTLDKRQLTQRAGRLPLALLDELDDGLRVAMLPAS